MDNYNKRVFWEALVIALFIFGLGILLGFLIEANRVDKIAESFGNSELNILDIKAQSEFFSLTDLDCTSAFEETLAFANRIYDEARLLEKYEGANKIGKEIFQQHKKYDLLRVLLFANYLEIKEKCKNKANSIIYFYEYQTEDLGTASLQNIFSNKLRDIKTEYGDDLILIPMASNLNVNSVNYLLKIYNITDSPAILINEKTVIYSAEELNNINNFLI